MTETYNCGACGDRRVEGAPHECWVLEKVQTQETILEICPTCFDPIFAPHWRCEEAQNVQPS